MWASNDVAAAAAFPRFYFSIGSLSSAGMPRCACVVAVVDVVVMKMDRVVKDSCLHRSLLPQSEWKEGKVNNNRLPKRQAPN